MASSYENKNKWTSWRKANYAFFESKLSRLSRELSIIDIGAGPEQFRDLTWRFKKTSVDFKQFGTTNIVSDLTKTIPLPSATSDIIFLSNVLEHMPYGDVLLKECHRLLRPTGIVIGTIPFISPIHQAPYDFHRYTSYMLELLLKDAEFSNIEITAIGKPIQLYLNLQDALFSHLPKTPSMKLYRFIERALYVMFRPFALKGKENNFFCQGYGFTAKKIIL